ncbi:hypothetical protein CHL67_10910 [Prosthecochloris sp. GSB1]|nr:hypothetical protein CHL67_10910 [Prosthecochloris sp. GSB1]
MNFPPMMTEGSSRAFKLAASMPGIGWEPLVVASCGLSGIGEKSEPFAVHYAGGEVPAESLDEEQLFRYAYMMPLKKGLLGKRGSIDPNGDIWEKKARPLVEKLLSEHDDIELVYAQSPPLGPHRLALELSGRHRLPVIFDCIGPCGDDRFEMRLVRSGHSFTLPSRGMKEYFLKKYRGEVGHGDLTIVQNGFSSLEPFAPASAVRQDAVMRWVIHVERAGSGDLKGFFAGMKAFSESQEGLDGSLSLVLAGRGQEDAGRYLAKAGLSGLVESWPIAHFREELDRCRLADVFCVLTGGGPGSDVSVPERLYDAMGMNVPLAGVVPPGEAAGLIMSAGGLVADPGDPEKAAGLVREAFRRWRQGARPSVPETVASKCRHDAAIEQLLGVMSGILPLY